VADSGTMRLLSGTWLVPVTRLLLASPRGPQLEVRAFTCVSSSFRAPVPLASASKLSQCLLVSAAYKVVTLILHAN